MSENSREGCKVGEEHDHGVDVLVGEAGRQRFEAVRVQEECDRRNRRIGRKVAERSREDGHQITSQANLTDSSVAHIEERIIKIEPRIIGLQGSKFGAVSKRGRELVKLRIRRNVQNGEVGEASKIVG